MQQTPRGDLFPQIAYQQPRPPLFLLAQRLGIPFWSIDVIHQNEGWLAPHREPHILGSEVLVGGMSGGIDWLPLFFAVRLGDKRVRVDAQHRDLMIKLDLARAHQARYGRG